METYDKVAMSWTMIFEWFNVSNENATANANENHGADGQIDH